MDFTLNNLLNTSLNWLFPQNCLNCQTTQALGNHPYCESCYLKLPFQNHSCVQCGQRLGAQSDYCGRCIINPPHFDACFCPFKYQDSIKSHIQDLKYHEKPEIAEPLIRLFVQELKASGITLPELLIPVPLHISRLRERGYNQSQRLTQHLSQQLNIPYNTDTITKHKKTPAQALLSFKERKKNINNCFQLTSSINAKSVAIIDDVITTGTTVNEIAKILKKNGVDYIQVWGIAHTA